MMVRRKLHRGTTTSIIEDTIVASKGVQPMKFRNVVNDKHVVHAPINPAIAGRIMKVCVAARPKARVVSSQHVLLNLAVYTAGVLAVYRAEYFPPAGSRVW